MAQVELMDEDNISKDFDDKENSLQICNVFSDDKENSLQNSNVFSRTSSTEKGYEELDVSELNMKLRYSVTPASSPMSQSYTANCMFKDVDANNLNNTIVYDNVNLTRSLNSTITKDNLLKTTKTPLQALHTAQFTEDKNISPLKLFNKESDVTITVTGNDIDDNLSLPSTSSSTVQTPEATTPTKDIPKTDGGSPIMRGLKSVLNMFIPSYTPTSSEILPNHKDISSESIVIDDVSKTLSASTPISSCKIKDNSSKRSSPLKESVIFNDGLERELQWKDDTTINFKEEKTSIHKTIFQTVSSNGVKELEKQAIETETKEMNTTVANTNVSNLEVSYKSSVADRPTDIDPIVVANSEVNAAESDSEFLDCETIYSKNESYLMESFENFHKIMPIVVDISHTALEGYVEEHINHSIHKKGKYDTAESVVPIIESESNQESLSVIFKSKDTTGLSDVKLTEALNNLPISTDIPSNLKDVDSSLQVDIQTINLPSDLSNVDNLHSKDAINNGSEGEAFERSIISELTEKKTLEPLKITVTTSDITENSVSTNHVQVSKSIEANQLLQEMIQIKGSHELCGKTCDSDKGARNNDIEIDPKILEIQKSEYATASIIENNIKTEFLDQADNHVSIICTTDIGSNNNESIVECETEPKFLDETFICEDFIHNANTQKTNININEKYNLCEVFNIMPQGSVNDIKENLLLNQELISTGISKDHDNISLNERYNVDTCSIQKNSMEFEDITSSKIQTGKIENEKSHIIWDSDNKTDIHDFEYVNDISLKFQNMGIENANQQSDYEDKITVMDCGLGSDTFVTSENGILDSKYYAPSNTDITMNDLETNLSRNNINHIQDETICNKLEKDTKFQLIELKNSLPSDVPLPDDDIDFKNSQSRSNLNQIISDSKLLASSNEELQESKETTNTDLTIKLVTLPDIIQAASAAPGKENLCNQKIFTVDISDMSAVIEDNLKVDNEKNLISTNNNLHFSVPEKDPSTDVPTIELHNKFDLKTGYSLNFDEIDNPFATKTNIRMSPQPEPLFQSPFTFENNKQKNKKCSNMTLENIENEIIKRSNDDINPSTYTVDFTDPALQNISPIIVDLPIKSGFDNIEDYSTISKPLTDSEKDMKLLVENAENNNSLGGKHADSENSKSVFNLPEIDDSEFNPFRTISRICPSPPQILDLKDTSLSENNDIKADSTLGIIDQVKSTHATICTDDNIHYDKDISNVSSTTLRNSNEVHTEDEDTIEGPYIETEDLAEGTKASDIAVEKDVVQFKDLPATLNNEDDVNGELFIDAETFDFLLNQNKSNVVADSGKESLFLKFDPLFAKRVSSDGVLAALGSMRKKQSTPKKLTFVHPKNVALEQTFDVSPSVESLSEENDALLYLDEIGNSICKPMMVVNPAINSNATPKKSATSYINRGSSTFASPAMLVIDRLLSQSDNTTLLDQDDLMPHIRKNHEADIALTQLREHLADKEVHVHNLKCETKELRDRLFTLESQVRSLENESKERLRKINDLNEHLIEKTKSNNTMATVVEEYERTIATLITEIEQERRQNAEERAKLINERDEQTEHLTSMERSFSDLHSKYEKSKQILLSMKANEDTYKKSLKEFDDNLIKMHNNYEQLKQHATSKLNSANQELDKINRAHHKEVAKLNAMIKRKNLHVTTLEESLAQKIKVNEKLTAICDELINKVG